MNRNTGVTKTFSVAHFPRDQVLPITFGYVRSNTVKTPVEMVVNIKTAELEEAEKNGDEVVTAFVFAHTVLANSGEVAKTGATKLRLQKEYRRIKLNQNTTRFVVTGFFE